ncbi:FHIP family protein AAEL005291 isoform X2 [Hylaeus volcanicus]|uniref:FHIP family protein AAEL005291 isoform X2 n=1 Tax=Hylaeus volcanicus TaxID=313075 RepID=UPI0023B781C3|nr:FHIP family protein AAEL005291 isoform X2 [Hylaeus volcanicus]
MSWLRGSPLRTSFSKQRSRDSPPKDADPSACYDSFCKHWQQAYEIILHTSPPKGILNQDDVLGVVNHIDHMVTLLVLELRDSYSHNNYRQSTTATHSPCLEYLLSENLLVKLYDWSINTGRFNNAVRLEQLKLYELLVSHNSILLAHEPVARPLLRLLEDCANDIMPLEVEKKLVVLLNQLCVTLMQNMALLDLFFHPTATGKNKLVECIYIIYKKYILKYYSIQICYRFIIFTLLIPHVHREGGVGQQARDAMLLCMSLSKRNDEVGVYIADHSNICPVLATGLSGLYSLLPRKLDIETDDWHRLTPDDVNDLPALMHLMNSLEFCNAVAQVAHPLVQKQLLEFLYHGFLVPVMGPALLQDSLGLTIEQLDAQEHWTTVEELVAATAYFDLFLRSVTDPGLLRSLVRFLLEDNYDECRILDSFIKRISSRSRLCIVTLALFETLVNLNCEDVMLELCLAALSPCSHVMLSQRRRLRDIDPFGRAAEKFLSLMPNCCSPLASINTQFSSLPNNASQENHSNPASESLKSLPVSINYGARSSDSLYGNYHAYLCDARQKIRACRIACSNWSYQYYGEFPKNSSTSSATTLIDDNALSDRPPKKAETTKALSLETLKQSTLDGEINENSSMDNMLLNIQSLLDGKELQAAEKDEKTESLTTTGIELSLEEQAKLDADIAELLSEDIGASESIKEISSIDKKEPDSGIDDSNTAMNSLLSLGESSGYESFAFKGSSESTPDNESSEDRMSEHEKVDVGLNKEHDIFHSIMEPSSVTAEDLTVNKQSKDSYRQDVFNGQPNVGIFLDVLLRKLECMTSNNLYVNLHLTGLISRLAIYPQPLLQSFLLNHSLVFQPSIRSLFQVLASLKHKIDQYLSQHNNVDVLVEQAQLFLISREDKLVNARKNALEAAAHSAPVKRNSVSGEPFSRGESKRWSLTSSFTQMLRRSSGGGSGSSSLIGTINQPTGMPENQLEAIGHGSGYRYYTKTSWESPNEVSPVQNVVLCAVILDEWLKELAAITQEHAIMSFTHNLEFKV